MNQEDSFQTTTGRSLLTKESLESGENELRLSTLRTTDNPPGEDTAGSFACVIVFSSLFLLCLILLIIVRKTTRLRRN